MKSFLVFLLLFNFFGMAYSQVQWCDEVSGYSSARTEPGNDYAYKPLQATGVPSILPDLNQNYSLSAWMPELDDKGLEFIEVKFSKAMKTRQVIINENYNPGSVVKIELLDNAKNVFQTVTDSTGMKKASPVMPLTIMLDPSESLTSYVKVYLNTSLKTGAHQIDAIGISESPIPYEIKVNYVNYSGKTYAKELLPASINSRSDELLPVISPDGKTIYFVRQGHFGNPDSYTQHAWSSTVDSTGLFSEASYFPSPINNTDNNAICSVTPDGQKLLLLNVYLPNGTMEKGASISTKNGNDWSFPQKLEIEDFYNDSPYGEYYLMNDGKTMLLTTQRKEGFGNKDIQVCFLKEDGKWTKPKNLGPIINTASPETSPFMASDGKTLYFASRGHLGYGSNDVFMTTRLSDNWEDWSEPINLGPSINSKGWDAYYTIPASGEYAYFVNYSDTSKGDIYRIKLPDSARPAPVALVRGHVYDAETKLPLESTVRYESLIKGNDLGIARSNINDGAFSIVLPSGDYYGFLANAPNYYPLSQNLDLRKLSAYKEQTIDLFLYPIKVGQKVKLNNVFFDTGKYSFRNETYKELDRLVDFMLKNPSVKIAIQGHTDNQGEDASNMVLSNQRAKAVYDYLLKKGVLASQLSFKGYGETQPVESNSTELGRQNNRRVVLLIEKI